MCCGCKAIAIDIGGGKDGERTIGFFPLLSTVIMVDWYSWSVGLGGRGAATTWGDGLGTG